MENSLPKGWVSVSPLEISEKIRGVSYGKEDVFSKPKDEAIPVLRANGIEDNKIIYDDIVYVRESRISDNQLLRSGDVLIAMSSGSKNLVGKTAQFFERQRVSFGAFCGVLRPNAELNSKYFGYFFQSKDYRDTISELAAGTNINNLKNEHFESLRVPLPPLQEQQRIVAKLDELMEKIDRSRARLERIPKILKRFRQSILSAAVSGKLTEEWREKNKNVKSIFDNIDSIIEERQLDFENLIKELSLLGKSKPRKPENLIPKISASDDFPTTWGMMSFSDISSIKRYSMSSGPFGSSLGTKDYRSNGIPVVRGQNIQGGVFIAKNFVFISEEKAIELARSSAIPNDIVIVAVGVGVGNAAIIPNEIEKIILSQNCNKFSLDFKIAVPKYILYNLQVSSIKEQMDEATTDTAREFLSLTNLKKLLFPIPPFEEQKEIVRRVEQLFSLADKIEARYTKAKAQLDKLPQSLLAKAFRGELVPQDSTDEPASVLLERIKKEKSTPAGKTKKLKRYEMEDEKLSLAAED